MARSELKWVELLKQNLACIVLLGQRTDSNSSLQDVSRVKYLHGYIGAVLDALRYAITSLVYLVDTYELELLELNGSIATFFFFLIHSEKLKNLIFTYCQYKKIIQTSNHILSHQQKCLIPLSAILKVL